LQTTDTHEKRGEIEKRKLAVSCPNIDLIILYFSLNTPHPKSEKFYTSYFEKCVIFKLVIIGKNKKNHENVKLLK